MLDRAGIDSIEISGNGTSFGGIRALDTIENVLNLTKIEAVSMSRPLLREPDLPLKWQQDPSVISKCISCNRCYQSEAHKCVFREQDQQRD